MWIQLINPSPLSEPKGQLYMLNLKCIGSADPNGPLGRSSPRQTFQPGDMQKLMDHFGTLVSPVTGSPLFGDGSSAMDELSKDGCLHSHCFLVVHPQAVHDYIAANEDEDQRLIIISPDIDDSF